MAIAALLVTLIAGRNDFLSAAQAAPPPQSHVCGSLSGDTTWTESGGPYELDCTVTVPARVTLTIDAGATVYAADGAALKVAGALQAVGSSGSPIVLESLRETTGSTSATTTSCGPASTQSVHPWCGIQLQGASSTSSVSYTEIDDAAIGLWDYPAGIVSNDTFKNDGQAIGWDANAVHPLTISNGTFLNTGLSGAGGAVQITDSSFISGPGLANPTGSISLTDSVIRDEGVNASTVKATGSTFSDAGGTALHSGNGTLAVSHSTISGSATGIRTDASQSVSISHSVVQSNSTGIDLDLAGTDVHINRNNIELNGTNLAVENGNSSIHLDATNNWWGQASSQGIQSSIRDCNRGNQVFCVSFIPFLGQPMPCGDASADAVPCAPDATETSGTSTAVSSSSQITSTSVSTDTPTPTSTDTPTPIGTDTPTPVNTDTPTPTATDADPTPTDYPTATDVPTDVATNTTPGSSSIGSAANSTSASTQPIGPVSLSVSPGSVAPGSSTSVSGGGFAPGETVIVSYVPMLPGGGALAEETSGQTASDGSFTANNLQVPTGILPGNYVVIATGQSSRATATTTLTVLPVVQIPNGVQATPTAGARSSVSIANLAILHDVGGHEHKTTALHVDEAGTFAITISVTDSPQSAVSFTWTILKNGRMVAHHGRHAPPWEGQMIETWSHAIHDPGDYVFVATASTSGVKQQKILSFTVAR